MRTRWRNSARSCVQDASRSVKAQMAKAKPAKRVRAVSNAPAAPPPAAAPEAVIRVPGGLKAQVRDQVRSQVRGQVRSMAGRLHKSALRRDAILAAALE